MAIIPKDTGIDRATSVIMREGARNVRGTQIYWVGYETQTVDHVSHLVIL